MQTVTGVIERVIFHNAENGFCVLRVLARDSRDPVTVVGYLPVVCTGEQVDAAGEWINDSTHGPQLKARELRATPPATRAGIEKYLGSGLIDGIGPHFAKRLVETFGEDVFEVIENDPTRLKEVPGIGKKRQSLILDAWQEQKVVRDIMVFLHSHGVGTSKAVRIFKTYGKDAIATVRQNPYRLAGDVFGIGFETADSIARSIGIPVDSPRRAEAGITHVLNECSSAGHCAFPREALLDRSTELLGIPRGVLEEALVTQIGSGQVIDSPIANESHIYLTPLYHAETRLAETLLALNSGEHPLPDIDFERAVTWVEAQVELELAPSQREALEAAVRNKVLVLTGGPGVGKTTLIQSVLAIFSAKKLRCLLCAPTGRAARRLGETTKREAKTIHRLLEFNPGKGGFQFDQDRPLECDAVILDEASMVDTVLMYQLTRAIPKHAAFLVVGDVDQLPSVGPGQVLRDLIESRAMPVVRLTEIFRQAALSQIITNAHRILRGEMPESPSDSEDSDFYFIETSEPEVIAERVQRMVQERIPKRFNLDPVRDIQVLTPMNRSSLGTRALNAQLQAAINPPVALKAEIARFGYTFRVGDKVMQIKNNYDKDVFNGDVGSISSIDDEREVAINFYGDDVAYKFSDLDEIVPAYACSIHKSQGSEYPAVVIPLHTQHYMMLYRNVLYTAVTRARKLAIIVGSRKALSLAVERDAQDARVSGLREHLNPRQSEAE